LRAHRVNPVAGNAVGRAVLRPNKAPFSQAQKHIKGTIRQDVTFACETGDRAYLAALGPVKVDGSTKGEFMQNTLFVF